jgi:hypothetical protein
MGNSTTDDVTLTIVPQRGPAYRPTRGTPRNYQGWISIEVTRSLSSVPSSFSLEMTELYPAEMEAMLIQPGDFAEISFGRDVVMTGYVDRFLPSIAPGSHSIHVVGRGKCQDLVDCSLGEIWPGSQIMNNNVLQIAQKLASPYNIKVAAADGADLGAVIPSVILEVTGDIIDNVGGILPNPHNLAQLRQGYDSHTHQIRNVQGGSASLTTDTPSPQE